MNFNLKQVAALSVLAFAGSAALADDITMTRDMFASQKTRAEVQAEVTKAIADGTLTMGGEIITMRAMAARNVSVLSREQVRAQLSEPKPIVSALLQQIDGL